MTRRFPTWWLLAGLLAAGWLAYLPGLSGSFLFDDFVNLPAIGATGPVDDWPTFWRYLTSGTADPTGRPLALLSFLLDARTWPADPAPFLRSNVLLHLANAALLFALLRALGRHLGEPGARADAAALVGAGAWLLHPLLVSTTLYIVQREAMLPATFVLLGLLAYVHGRVLHARAPRAGVAWMAAGIGGGTLLAVLCKANGALLPLLALVLEETVLRAGDGPHAVTRARARALRWSRRLLLVLPTLLVLAYLLSYLPRLGDDLASRPWTIGQRLLTEPRVLLDYLHLLVVPRALTSGVYNDAYTASTGWLQPASTLPTLLTVVALPLLAWAARRRMPALAAAVLFFFAGHLLESSIVPLELYFEHRNYLPALLLGWPLGRAIVAWHVQPAVRATVAVALLALLGVLTWQRATLWGQPERMALVWAAQNPASSRAQATAASAESKAGRPDLAARRLAPRWADRPHDLQLGLNYANAACATGGLPPGEIQRIGNALRHAQEGGQLVHRWLRRSLGVARAGGCRGLDLAVVEAWTARAEANPLISAHAGLRQDLRSLRGEIALARDRPDLALSAFDAALAERPRASVAAKQAALLASRGHHREALAHLDRFERLDVAAPRDRSWTMKRVHQWVLRRQGYWARELGLLRGKLEAAGRDAE